MAPLAESNASESLLSETLSPGTRVGNYRVERLLGKGGMGAVYEAVHLYIERRAAIKVLHAQLSRSSEFRTRFLNEARAVNLIKHPGLVEVYEFGLLDDGTAYIVMEFLHGESLEQHIGRHPHGLGAAALPIAHDIAQAMVAAHQKGIVHRDLKPANIMCASTGNGPGKGDEPRVKILDFGIAKMSQETEGSLRTETGATIGTPAYMAPEQCLSAPNVDGKADVYALGIILYELLSGRLPFSAKHSFDFMAAHVRSEPQPITQLLPDLPPEVENLVHSMLVKDPTLRPSMETVTNLLQEILAAGEALWSSDPQNATELGQLGRQQVGQAATLSQPPRAARHSKELLEISATAPGVGVARLSRELAQISAVPSSQISGNARVSDGAVRSGSRASAADVSMNRVNLAASGEAPVAPEMAPPQTTHSAPPRSSLRFLWVAAVLVTALSVSIWLAIRPKPNAPLQPASSPGTKPATVRTVKWQLRTQPAGAEVVRSDGYVLGSTPFQLVRLSDSGESQITLRLPGYLAKTLVLSHSTDVETDMVLTAQPVVSPAAPRDSAVEPAARAEEPHKTRGKSSAPRGKRGRKSGKDTAADSDGVKLLMD